VSIPFDKNTDAYYGYTSVRRNLDNKYGKSPIGYHNKYFLINPEDISPKFLDENKNEFFAMWVNDNYSVMLKFYFDREIIRYIIGHIYLNSSIINEPIMKDL